MAQEIVSQDECARISDAVRSAEANTAGEIYVVIAKEADDFRFVPLLWAGLIALLMPWPLHLLTYWPTWLILLLQAIVFVTVALVGSHPFIRHHIVPGPIAASTARRSAEALFMAHGVHLTQSRTGLLIYVALADRRVEIVTDVGISSKVSQHTWDKLAQDVAEAARKNSLIEGLIGAVARAGILLSQHCPQGSVNPNELSDRVVQI